MIIALNLGINKTILEMLQYHISMHGTDSPHILYGCELFCSLTFLLAILWHLEYSTVLFYILASENKPTFMKSAQVLMVMITNEKH